MARDSVVDVALSVPSDKRIAGAEAEIDKLAARIESCPLYVVAAASSNFREYALSAVIRSAMTRS